MSERRCREMKAYRDYVLGVVVATDEFLAYLTGVERGVVD